MSLTYSLAVIPKENNALKNLESEYVVRNINNLPNVVLEKNYLRYNNIEQNEQTIYLHKDICGEFYKTPSIESTSVPDISNYKFLIKDGISYTYVYEKPVEDIYIDVEILSTLKDSIVDMGNTEFYKVFSNSRVGAITPQHISTVVSEEISVDYDCYSFAFGGISKTYSYFYFIDNNSNLKILNIDDNTLVDYVEGYVYVDRSISNGITQIHGLFNIEPVNIIPKGDFKITSNSSGFYKLQNVSDKQLLKLFAIDKSHLGLISSVNSICKIVSTSSYFCIDGVFYDIDQPLVLKKDVLYTLSVYDGAGGPVSTDFLNNLTRMIGDASSFDNITASSYERSFNTNSSDIFLHVYKEIDRNTYNFDRPLVFKVKFTEDMILPEPPSPEMPT